MQKIVHFVVRAFFFLVAVHFLCLLYISIIPFMHKPIIIGFRLEVPFYLTEYGAFILSDYMEKTGKIPQDNCWSNYLLAISDLQDVQENGKVVPFFIEKNSNFEEETVSNLTIISNDLADYFIKSNDKLISTFADVHRSYKYGHSHGLPVFFADYANGALFRNDFFTSHERKSIYILGHALILPMSIHRITHTLRH